MSSLTYRVTCHHSKLSQPSRKYELSIATQRWSAYPLVRELRQFNDLAAGTIVEHPMAKMSLTCTRTSRVFFSLRALAANSALARPTTMAAVLPDKPTTCSLASPLYQLGRPASIPASPRPGPQSNPGSCNLSFSDNMTCLLLAEGSLPQPRLSRLPSGHRYLRQIVS